MALILMSAWILREVLHIQLQATAPDRDNIIRVNNRNEDAADGHCLKKTGNK